METLLGEQMGIIRAIMISKIISIASIGSTIANTALLRRYLAGISSVVALTVITALMFGLLLIAAFTLFYLSMVHYGLEPVVAALIIFCLTLLLLVLLVGMVIVRLNRLNDIPYGLPRKEIPSPSRLGEIASAFFSGLLDRSHLTKP